MVQIANAGRTSDEERWLVRCVLCTETELVGRVGDELGKVISTLHTLSTIDKDAAEASPQEPVEPAPVLRATDLPPEPVSSSDPLVDADPQPRWSRMARAGLGIVLSGVAISGAGAALAALPPQPLDHDPLRERYTQPPGYALLAIGGAAVITGIVLLTVGRRKTVGALALQRPGTQGRR